MPIIYFFFQRFYSYIYSQLQFIFKQKWHTAIYIYIDKYLILLSPYWTPRQDPHMESKWGIVEKERKDTESVN